MGSTIELIVDSVFYLVCVLAAVAWVRLIRSRTLQQLPLLQPEDRTKPFWTLAEFFVCFGMYIICLGAGQQVGRRWMSPETQERIQAGTYDFTSQNSTDLFVTIVYGSAASVLAMASVLVWMNLIHPRSLREFGLWLSSDDVKLGAKVAFFVLPPVLLLSTVIDKLVPYEHPVLDLIGQSPDAVTMLMMALTTIVVAPIFEEFIFRVLLQGGSQRLADKLKLAAQAGETPVQNVSLNPSTSDVIEAVEVSQWPWWPVLLSSSVFSALHIGQGFAPIPLFFLSVALGYVYRQTGRIGPGLVVHAILNSLTISLSILQILLTEPTG